MANLDHTIAKGGLRTDRAPTAEDLDRMLREVQSRQLGAKGRAERDRSERWLNWLKGVEQRRSTTCRSS